MTTQYQCWNLNSKLLFNFLVMNGQIKRIVSFECKNEILKMVPNRINSLKFFLLTKWIVKQLVETINILNVLSFNQVPSIHIFTTEFKKLTNFTFSDWIVLDLLYFFRTRTKRR